jgi:dTDP-4-amino-4,6-dideoxygalactose transaminase
VFYQYCAYVPDRDTLVRCCLRQGLDLETLHVDVCTDLPLVGGPGGSPGAETASRAVQVPVHASLTAEHLARVAQVVRQALGGASPPVERHVPAVRS